MAHEMGHVKNYDIRVSTIVFGLVSAIGILADFALRMAFWANQGSSNRSDSNNQLGLLLLLIGVVGSIVAFLIGPLVSAAVSRQREYLADATGALTTRDPDGLASALAKLETHAQPLRRENTSMAHLWFSDPLRPGAVSRLFATHPPIPDRIARLQHMGDRF